MLARVKQLTADALGAFRGDRIPVRSSKVRPRRANARRTCPRYEVVQQISEVIVSFQVPGATVENTELCWDPELQTLSMHVNLPGERHEEFGAVLAFTSDVDGARGNGILTEHTLRVCLPRRDVDTLTALPAETLPADAGLIAAI